MDKSESWSTTPGEEASKKRATVRTNGERPSKAAQIWAPSNTRRSGDVPVLRRQCINDGEVEVQQLVKARDIKDSVEFLLL